MISFLFVILFTFIAAGLGWSVIVRLDNQTRLNAGERLVISFFIGCLIVYFGVFIVGPFRLDSLSMGLLIGLLALASMPGLMQMTWAMFGRIFVNELKNIQSDKWLAALWISVAVVSASSLIQGLAPPNDYDSLMYHLSIPQYDIENGKITVFWERGGFILFPALGTHLTRVALAIADAGAAQMLHGLLVFAAGIGSGLLVLRLGWGKKTALAASLMFLSIRSVIWEMATVETDAALAAFVVFSAIVYLAWRPHREPGLAVLFGLMIGCGILIKYHGFIVALSFAPLIVFDLFRRNGRPVAYHFIGPLVSLLVVLPHLIRNFVYTNNPVFPLLNPIFNPGLPDHWAHVIGKFGTGRELTDLFVAPWYMFIQPMHYFDGMMMGAPYLLAFAPLLLLDREVLRRWLPVLSIIPVYYLIWFYLLPKQVRFLLPVMPLIAAMATVGVVTVWRQLSNRRGLRLGLITIASVFAINQFLFVGVYAGVRLPPALGLVSPLDFHEKTPTMTGAYYKTCSYIRKNLEPGEKYLSLIKPHSFYCPQVAATWKYFSDESDWWLFETDEPDLSYEEFLTKMEQERFRFLIVPKGVESRYGNRSAKARLIPINLSSLRIGKYLDQVLSGLSPVIEGPYTAVYDGRKVLGRLPRP